MEKESVNAIQIGERNIRMMNIHPGSRIKKEDYLCQFRKWEMCRRSLVSLNAVSI